VQAAEQVLAATTGSSDLPCGVVADTAQDVYRNHLRARELTLKERLSAERQSLET
jgi:DNA polymerase-3 subunit alpha